MEYDWKCPSCDWGVIKQEVNHMIESTGISKLKVRIINGMYEIDPYSFTETFYSNTDDTTVTFTCADCGYELTQEDIRQLAFDNNL